MEQNTDAVLARHRRSPGGVFVRAAMTAMTLVIAARPAPVPAAPSGPARSFKEQSRNLDGVWLRLVELSWCDEGDAIPGGAGDPHGRGLCARFDADTYDPKIQFPDGRTFADYLRSAHLYGPQGQPISPGIQADANFLWRDADPRWTKATVEVEFLHPLAPPEAAGRFRQQVVFPGVPVPEKPDVPSVLNRTFTTDRGTRITLEKVALKKSNAWPGPLCFVVGWQPPKQAPELTAHLYPEMGGVVDDQGADLTVKGRGIIGEDVADRMRRDRGRVCTVQVLSAPSAGARTVDLALAVSERAESLVDRR